MSGKLGYYRYPPVDPVTGEVSAREDSILMGAMRHCDVPEKHRKSSCVFEMNAHFFRDYADGRYIGEVICPDQIIAMIEELEALDPRYASAQVLNAVLKEHRGWRLEFDLHG